MPDGRIEKAKRAVQSILHRSFPEQWETMEKGLNQIMEGARESDLWLDAVGHAGSLETSKLVGLAQVLMGVGAGQVSADDARQSLMSFRISGEPNYQTETVQTPGLQQAMQNWEAGGVPKSGPLANAYDRQMGEGGERFQQLQQQGLLGPAPQPQIQGSPLAQPQGAGLGEHQQNWKERGDMLRSLLQ